MKVLFTGSEGEIGKTIKEKLKNKFNFIWLDMIEKNEKNYYQVDLFNLDELKKVFQKEENIDCVVHSAAVSDAKSEWDLVLRNNIIATKNIYDCCKEFGIKKIVYFSSNRLTLGYEEKYKDIPYTQKNETLITIKDEVRPLEFYGVSKIFGEAIARMYYEVHGISSICLRIGSFRSHDNPAVDPTKRFFKTWIFADDLAMLVEKSIKSKIGFGIYYGVSNNYGRFWDYSNAEKEIGYNPTKGIKSKL